MQLGSILQEQTGSPCVSHPVEFSLLKMTANGKMRFRVRALMFPVTEADRLTSARIAVDSLRALPEYKQKESGELPPIPLDVLNQERVYKFLQAALYSEVDPMCRLIPESDYQTFRSGVVREQVDWLWDQYEAFIKREYPELAPMGSLVEEALGNSKADPSAPARS